MKASYSQLPAPLEQMPEGHTKFRFDIVQVENGDATSFECREVNIPGAVTAEKVIASAIAEKWGNGVEQKLINDYNEFKAGLSEDISAEAAYLEFLSARKDLKESIHQLIPM